LYIQLGDERRSNSRVSLNRDFSRKTLNRDGSRASFLNMDTRHTDSHAENLNKEKEKLEKRIKELELSKIKVIWPILIFSWKKKMKISPRSEINLKFR
jgi:hypothetical protein